MITNRISAVLWSAQPSIDISGLTRAEFDRISADEPEHFNDQTNRYYKAFTVVAPDAYLRLSLSTNQPPVPHPDDITVPDIKVLCAEGSHTECSDPDCGCTCHTPCPICGAAAGHPCVGTIHNKLFALKEAQ